MELRVGVSTPDLVLADWDRVALFLWRGHTTVAGLRFADRFLAEHVERCKNFALLLTVVEPTAPLPALEARRELAKALQGANGRVERSAVVFEGDWIRATSVRAIVAGASLFAAPNYPHRVFATLVAAIRFLGVEQQGPHAVECLTELVSAARRAPSTSRLPDASWHDRDQNRGWSS